MKLLAVKRHDKTAKLFEANPRAVKSVLTQVFKETNYDYAIAMNQGKLYIMELRQDVTELNNPADARENPQWNTTEIKYHPLASKLVNPAQRQSFLNEQS